MLPRPPCDDCPDGTCEKCQQNARDDADVERDRREEARIDREMERDREIGRLDEDGSRLW